LLELLAKRLLQQQAVYLHQELVAIQVKLQGLHLGLPHDCLLNCYHYFVDYSPIILEVPLHHHHQRTQIIRFQAQVPQFFFLILHLFLKSKQVFDNQFISQH
jgi:hypothetical protein